MRGPDAIMHSFDGEFPGNPGQQALSPVWHGWSQATDPLQPEVTGELIQTYRSGRIVHIFQDLNSMAHNNEYPYVTYGNYRATNRQPIEMVYANILNSAPIPGTEA